MGGGADQRVLVPLQRRAAEGERHLHDVEPVAGVEPHEVDLQADLAVGVLEPVRPDLAQRDAAPLGRVPALRGHPPVQQVRERRVEGRLPGSVHAQTLLTCTTCAGVS